MRKTFWLLIFIVSSMLIMLVSSAASPPTLSLSYNSVSYGQYLKISATAHSSGDTLKLYINNNLSAGPDTGSLNYSICSTDKTCLRPGLYAITVYDLNTTTSSEQNLVITPVAPQLNLQKYTAAYGDSFKITATPPLDSDYMEILLNGSELAANTGYFIFTTCYLTVGDKCITPGNYNVIVYDTSEGVYSLPQKLTVTAVSPQLSMQNNQLGYGKTQIISATAPVGTDGIEILANSTYIATSTGNITFKLCGSTVGSCLAPGQYNIRAYDPTEGIYSSNQILTITPTLAPRLQITYYTTNYGKPDAIEAFAPYKNDSVEILINNLVVASGIGSVNYTVCSLVSATPCLHAGANNITAYDTDQKIYSSNSQILIYPVLPTLSISSNQTNFGVGDNITATAALYGDLVAISINGANVISGTGTIVYNICAAAKTTSCLRSGSYNISACDGTEGICSKNKTLLVFSQVSTTVGSVQQNSSSNKSNNSTATNTVSKKSSSKSSKSIMLKGYLRYIPYIAIAIVVIIVVVILLTRLMRRNVAIAEAEQPPAEQQDSDQPYYDRPPQQGGEDEELPPTSPPPEPNQPSRLPEQKE